jgi:hypothetical protein
MKLGQNACLGNCSDEFDWSGERSRVILALMLSFYLKVFNLKILELENPGYLIGNWGYSGGLAFGQASNRWF